MTLPSPLCEFRSAAHAALDLFLDGADLSALPSPEDLVAYGTRAQKIEHELASAVGAVYDTPGVERLLGIARQQVADRRARGTILALRTEDVRWVYPTFQFEGGRIRPHVRALLDVFRAAPHGDWWTVAAWMNTGHGSLGGAAPAWVEEEQVRSQAVALARQAAARWSA